MRHLFVHKIFVMTFQWPSGIFWVLYPSVQMQMAWQSPGRVKVSAFATLNLLIGWAREYSLLKHLEWQSRSQAFLNQLATVGLCLSQYCCTLAFMITAPHGMPFCGLWVSWVVARSSSNLSRYLKLAVESCGEIGKSETLQPACLCNLVLTALTGIWWNIRC